MFVPVSSAPTFKDFTLIMPAISVGNVGQLAVDLIISTLNLNTVGYIHTASLIPMVGNNPYATSDETSTELSTNAEVYSLPEIKLAVLQIRSPILQTKYRQFQNLILTWIKTSEFSKAIILSSSHAYQRDDRQLLGTPLRYLLTPAMQSIVGDNLQMMNWKKMEKIAVFPEISNTRQHLYIPGGGITKQLYNVCCSEGIPLAVLLVFCSEGDNMPDAFVLINYLNEWLHLVENACDQSSNWKIPCSWRLLFGSGIPPALF
ncbi:proteasome assembly chaperone 2 [Huso huso]|uniref:Proteasome assembly chaperone 2 n=2 Tax=Acipenseridae TaxID=7900 RepID=A0AAD8LQY8_ACIOX|nr:proteasome assembly chaperone 2 [Acipenser oxyrinchus oxyrinchus]